MFLVDSSTRLDRLCSHFLPELLISTVSIFKGKPIVYVQYFCFTKSSVVLKSFSSHT